MWKHNGTAIILLLYRTLLCSTFLYSGLAWSQAPSQKILAASTETSRTAFVDFLEKNENYKPYSQHIAIEHDSTTWQRVLVQAQNHFLQGSMEKALSLFKKIANSRHSKDWSWKHRERIVYSLFRLSQMAKVPKEKQQWIQKALNFSQEMKPAVQTFPPPVFETWSKLKKSKVLKNYVLPGNSGDFETLKINGKKVNSISGLIRTHSGQQRFSFYSDRYAPFHWVGQAKGLENLAIPLNALVEGSCRQPSKNLPLGVDRVLFPKNCLKTKLPATMELLIESKSQELAHKPKSFWKRNQTLIWVSAVVVSGIATWQYLENSGPGPGSGQQRTPLSNMESPLPPVPSAPIQISNQR